jgi:uncharacterized protein (TIGR00369 family)
MTVELDAPAADHRNAFSSVPFTRWLGARREFSQGGRARLVLDARPELENMIHAVHGGVVATLLDVAMASAAVSQLDFAMTAVTLNMNTSFMQPGRGRLVADGEVLAVDDGVAACRARVVDEGGRLVALAHGSFRYLPHRPPRPPQGETA